MRSRLLTMFLLASCVAAGAQHYDLQSNREPIVSLASSKWRFHTGDDPKWSAADLDDSSWALLKSDSSWSSQGYSGLHGYAWYRFTIETPAGATHLALRLPQIATNYEVFADGVRVGGCGRLEPTPQPTRCTPQVFDLPDAHAGRPIVVALRVWHWPAWAGYFGGGPTGAGSFGASNLIHKQLADSRKILRLSVMPYWILSLLYMLGAISAFLLYGLRRSEREYLWFGLMVLAESLEFSWAVLMWTQRMPVRTGELIDNGLNLCTWLAAILFFSELLHARRRGLFWASVIAVICLPVITVLFYALPWFENHVALSNAATSFLLLFPSTWIVVLLMRRARRRFLDAVLLLIPAIILYGSGLLGSVFHILRQVGFTVPLLEEQQIMKVPFPLDVNELASFLFLIGMLAILINRFTRTRRVEERYASEFESARHIQEVLVPVPLAHIPGFQVEAEYRPARVVGGDFYQVLPDGNNGLLIVVGDVAGKGMPAAMLVAMIIGVVRTQATYSFDPATMLRALNERLCGHSSGGFSTCLVAHISKGGELTISNAGHLSPYLNGKELTVSAELPLGIESNVNYETEQFQLTPGDRLTFISDGIVEATNAKRELFGFERTEAISTKAATEIIAVAQSFGQNDDLTVVVTAYGT